MSLRRVSRGAVVRRARRLSGSAFLRVASWLTPAIAIESADGVFVVPSDDLSVRPKLFLDGTRGDLTYLGRAVDLVAARGIPLAGRTFVDVGANLGTTSVAAIRRHGFARVVACEPDPQNVRYLRATAALNGLEDTLLVVEAAVSDAPGRGAFASGKQSAAGHSTGTGTLRSDRGPETTEVEVVSLDALVERGVLSPDEVGMIWLDAQGYEGHVLAGASTLLAQRIPVVLALRRKELKRTGGRALLDQLANAHFSELVDLRPAVAGTEWRPIAQPVAAITSLIRERRFTTDVLLLP